MKRKDFIKGAFSVLTLNILPPVLNPEKRQKHTYEALLFFIVVCIGLTIFCNQLFADSGRYNCENGIC